MKLLYLNPVPPVFETHQSEAVNNFKFVDRQPSLHLKLQSEEYNFTNFHLLLIHCESYWKRVHLTIER